VPGAPTPHRWAARQSCRRNDFDALIIRVDSFGAWISSRRTLDGIGVALGFIVVDPARIDGASRPEAMTIAMRRGLLAI
jgi:hypothetical protein